MRIGLKSGVMIGRASGWKTGMETGLGPFQKNTRVNGTMMRVPIGCAESLAQIQIRNSKTMRNDDEMWAFRTSPAAQCDLHCCQTLAICSVPCKTQAKLWSPSWVRLDPVQTFSNPDEASATPCLTATFLAPFSTPYSHDVVYHIRSGAGRVAVALLLFHTCRDTDVHSHRSIWASRQSLSCLPFHGHIQNVHRKVARQSHPAHLPTLEALWYRRAGAWHRKQLCKDNTSKDPFSRCEICNKLGYRLSGRKTKSDYNIQKKRQFTLGIAYAW